MTDDAAKILFESTREAIESIVGRQILIQAQLSALQEAFLNFEGRRGVDVAELRRVLEQAKTTFASQHLVQIGETSPQTAAAIDIQGLLAKMLDQIKSSENP